MENDNENLDSTNEEVQVDTDETTVDDTTSTEGVDVSKVLETNKKLYKRAKDAETELKQYKSQSKPSTLPESKTDTSSIYEQVALLKNIEREEMDTIEDDAKYLGVDVIKYLKSPAGKTRLDVLRKEKKSKEASPAIGASSPVLKKFSQKDIQNMSVKDLEKHMREAE